MIHPEYLKTRIFYDGSSLQEGKELEEKLGFLDGQTTNPSNFIKALKQETGEWDLRFNKEALYNEYKKRVQQISKQLPKGSVSVEVYADQNTKAEEMIKQGREMFDWIPNAHIKLPVIAEGLKAAEVLVKEGMRVNMTLVFTQEQAAAVYAATRVAKKGDVFVSPFVGRFFDKNINGIDLIKNILQMYQAGDGHVEVLAASIRTGEQVSEVIAVGTDIVTCYPKAIKEWFDLGMLLKKPEDFSHSNLAPIVYQDIDLNKNWNKYNIKNEMTDAGLEGFVKDWNTLLI